MTRVFSGRATLFAGDSVSENFFHYLICDLVRLGYNISDVRSHTAALYMSRPVRVSEDTNSRIRAAPLPRVAVSLPPQVIAFHAPTRYHPPTTHPQWGTNQTSELSGFLKRLEHQGGHGGSDVYQIRGRGITERAQNERETHTPTHSPPLLRNAIALRLCS